MGKILRFGGRLSRALGRFDTLCVFVFIFAFALRINTSLTFVMNDEVGGGYRGYGYLAWGYFDTAQIFRGYLSNLDFVGLFNWSVKYDANYPLVPFLMASSMLLFNSASLEVARFPIEVLGALLAVVLYLLGRDLFSRTAGLVAGLLAAVDPVLLTYSRVAYLDVPFEFLFALSMLMFYRGLTKRSRPMIAVSGIACGLAIVARILGWVFLPLAAVMLVYWKFSSREKWRSIVKTSAIFTIALSSALMLAFPWVGFEISTGKYFSWFASVSPRFFGGTNQTPTSLFALTLGKLTIVELITFIIGIAVVVSYFTEDERKSSRLILILWLLAAFLSLEFLKAELVHYLVFFIPPLLLISGYGVWMFKRIFGQILLESSASWVTPKRLVLRKNILGVILLVLVVGTQAFIVVPYYPYFSMYSSQLISDPLKAGLFQGEEAIPDAVDYLRHNVPTGDTIAVAGQVHLFAYYLPEYRIVGMGEFYPYSHEPLAFLYLSGIRHLVVQIGFQQRFGNTDPALLMLQQFKEERSFEIRGCNEILVYDLKDAYTCIFPDLLGGEWKSYQGDAFDSADGFVLSIASNYTYVYAIKEIDNSGPRSHVVFACDVSDFTAESFRVELWSNVTHIANIYPARQKGIWTFDVSGFFQNINGKLKLILVATGRSPEFIKLRSLLFLD
jgi:hypothetical protein